MGALLETVLPKLPVAHEFKLFIWTADGRRASFFLAHTMFLSETAPDPGGHYPVGMCSTRSGGAVEGDLQTPPGSTRALRTRRCGWLGQLPCGGSFDVGSDEGAWELRTEPSSCPHFRWLG